MKKSQKITKEYRHASEYYRTLRTNLQYSALNEKHKIFLFVSYELNEKMDPSSVNSA